MRRSDAVSDERVTFVLIHGIGLSSTYMTPLAEELAEYGEVFIMDLPGASRPCPRPKIRCPSQDSPLVDAAMRLNGIADPIFVGHSMGAQIVVELMARRRTCFDARAHRPAGQCGGRNSCPSSSTSI